MHPLSLLLTFTALFRAGMGIPSNEELASVDLRYSVAYSSPLSQGSDAKYAIDNDFQFAQPTCVVTDESVRDPDGLHWLLIDLGVQYHNITEVRITPNPSKIEFSNEVGNIDVFIGKHLNVHPQSGIERLPWTDLNNRHDSNLDYCGSSSGELKSFMSLAIIKCRSHMQGRWIALRRSVGRLNFCLVNVYVKDAHSELFREWPISANDPSTIPPNVSGARGFIFRLGKYLNHGQCRVECLKNENCQAILFEQMRYGGTCQLIKKFEFSTNPHIPRLECRSGRCKAEEALAHKGQLTDPDPLPYQDQSQCGGISHPDQIIFILSSFSLDRQVTLSL
ncbi:hypothetical protein Ciccas_005446 [Cichlidogyrus casuarinus]|uniref:Apple domain-containing protein n=1 Tax=Cichlidogyrus casuarinus TaxID=1844966 RepID=A0ABD2Q8L5_9PLAT